jgi:predicted component of type VI protein secretion system
MEQTPTTPTIQEEKYQFPTEDVTLPSKGLLYPEGHPLRSGVIKMKYMTAKEEDILTNQNFIKNGTVINKLLQSLIVTPVSYNDLLIGDKNAILIAARILGYGADYTFEYVSPNTGDKEEVTIDLTELDDKELDESLMIEGRNEFAFTLPTSKVEITFKFLTHGDEEKIQKELKGLKKLNKQSSSELTTRLKHTLLSVNGDRDIKTIREFVDNRFLARDSKAFRNYLSEIMPDINMQVDLDLENGDTIEDVNIPLGISFFWPDA